MAGGVGKVADRGRAGKFKKPTRGGGKHFSRDLQPVDADGNQISMWAAGAKKDAEEDSSEEESSEEEEEDSDDAGASKEATRDDRKAQKKARKEAAIAKQKAKTVEVGDMPSSDEDEDSEEDDDMPANPNHSKAARKMVAKPAVEADGDVEGVTEGVSNLKAAPGNRKEKESLEAKLAKEKYMKLHTAGKTDEAKADLERLKLIREQRDAEAARRQAEKEERETQEKVRKQEIDAREAKKREAAAGPKKGSKKK